MHKLIPIAEQYGTPSYVYFQDIIEQNYKYFEKTFSRVHYAVKANNNIALLKILAKLNSGFDIVSGGELLCVLKAGGNPQKIVFSGVGKQDWEIELALKNNISCFNIESEFELFQIQKIAKSLNLIAPIAFRVNPDIPVDTHPYISTSLKENKFGVDYQDINLLYEKSQNLSNIKITGLACHLGSQIFSEEVYILAVEKLLAFNISIDHIDIGGGFGIDNNKIFNISALSEKIKKLTNKPIWVEPGRAIIANSGIFLTKVISLKKNFIIVDGAMNDFMRPMLYHAYHEIINLNNTQGESLHYDIVGPICETGDFFGKNRKLCAKENDILAITHAGAYGFCLSSNYNSRPRCAEILVANNKSYLIRERENLDDLSISFTKMHGLGNDFVVINNITQNINLTSEQIKFIANRHIGIGCDQILLIEPSDDPEIDFFYRIYNSDGSESGQCGNGARCLARYISDKKLSNKNHLKIKTLTSQLELYLENNLIRVNMGIPHDIKNFSSGISLSLGNPHIVFCVDAINAELTNQSLDDYNIGYMQIINKNTIKLRVFERGAGETQACGSGACAAVIAGITQNLLDHQVTVELKGGKLYIEWKGSNHPVWMTGPAETVFEGKINF